MNKKESPMDYTITIDEGDLDAATAKLVADLERYGASDEYTPQELKGTLYHYIRIALHNLVSHPEHYVWDGRDNFSASWDEAKKYYQWDVERKAQKARA